MMIDDDVKVIKFLVPDSDYPHNLISCLLPQKFSRIHKFFRVMQVTNQLTNQARTLPFGRGNY